MITKVRQTLQCCLNKWNSVPTVTWLHFPSVLVAVATESITISLKQIWQNLDIGLYMSNNTLNHFCWKLIKLIDIVHRPWWRPGSQTGRCKERTNQCNTRQNKIKVGKVNETNIWLWVCTNQSRNTAIVWGFLVVTRPTELMNSVARWCWLKPISGKHLRFLFWLNSYGCLMSFSDWLGFRPRIHT